MTRAALNWGLLEIFVVEKFCVCQARRDYPLISFNNDLGLRAINIGHR